jgi:hypothetical protein
MIDCNICVCKIFCSNFNIIIFCMHNFREENSCVNVLAKLGANHIYEIFCDGEWAIALSLFNVVSKCCKT